MSENRGITAGSIGWKSFWDTRITSKGLSHHCGMSVFIILQTMGEPNQCNGSLIKDGEQINETTRFSAHCL